MVEAIVGGLNSAVDLGLGLANLFEGKRQFNEQMTLANKQYKLQKTQYNDAKDRYDTTLKNQQQAVNALGDSFGGALEREQEALPTQRL